MGVENCLFRFCLMMLLITLNNASGFSGILKSNLGLSV
jgi:hypothetical protein